MKLLSLRQRKSTKIPTQAFTHEEELLDIELRRREAENWKIDRLPNGIEREKLKRAEDIRIQQWKERKA